MSRLAELLGTEHALLQAPMAGSQDGNLARAVCGAGAVGAIPCAMLDTAGILRELEAMHAFARAPFNLNFFCHTPPAADAAREAAWRERLAPYYAEFGIDPAAVAAGAGRTPFDAAAADLVEAYRPAIVSFHFGLPAPELLARVFATGAKVLSSATTVEEARWLAARGVHAIVAQGLEAGGHRGHFLAPELERQLGTFALVARIARAVDVPVIAAGGIADAEGVAAALRLGASGVQVGTAYLLCSEATTSAVHRAALASEDAAYTALTNVFTGRPARGIVNRAMRELGPLCVDVPEFPRATPAIAPVRAAAEARGSGDFSPLWAGQNTSGCRAVPAAEVTRDLLRGFA